MRTRASTAALITPAFAIDGDDMLTKRARRSSLDELAEWTAWADKVVTF